MNQERFEQFMRFFPPQQEILLMEPEELGPYVLRYMTGQHSMTNRFNFGQNLSGSEISNRFMEAWAWLELEGFIARRAQDQFGNDYFITRRGQSVAGAEDFEARAKAALFPDGMDPIIMRTVKPLFVRGDYDTAVFRAFKEVEVRVRRKDSSLDGEYGVDLMNKAFGPSGPLMKANKKDKASARDLFVGAFGLCRNPSAHREIKFEDPREVVDMICFANQLLRIIDRIK